MRNALVVALITAVILIFNGGFSQTSKYEGKIVRKIEFTGLTNVDADDLLDVMITEEGFPLKATEIRQDIKAVFRVGKFKNVKVEVEEYRDGVRIRFICEERPIVAKIEFRGLDELYDQDFTDLILIKEGDVLRTDLVENSVLVIKRKYEEEGLFNAVVRYKIKKIEKDKDENEVEVVFIIDEGEDIKITKISVLGARRFSADDLIDEMELDEESILTDGSFKRDVYEQDKGKILSYYKERGYLDAQIVEDKVEYEWDDPETEDKRVIFITIKVSEGEKYYFDKYTIKGNKVFDTKALMAKLEQIDSGDVFNNTLFEKDRQMLGFMYSTEGYIFARIIPRRTVEEREVDEDGKKEIRKFVRIDFEIIEGRKAYVENIIVKGNKKTKDKVIKRELLVKEGELFNSFKMQRSRERVYNLGFFKQVNFDIRPGSKDGFMNLIVDVEEQPTGTISLGGGYGTTTGFSIFADVGENNLLGYGHRIGVKFEYGPLRNSITLSYRWPWLFDYPVYFLTSVFYSLITIPTSSLFSDTGDAAEYKKQESGYSLGLSYRFWYFYGVGTVWRHSFKSLVDPTGNSPDAVFIEESLGLQEKRSLTFYVYRDSKDNYMNPTKGWRFEFSVEFTGGYILRGDDHFIKYSPDLYYYYSPFNLPFLRTHPCVIELRANASFIKPPFQRNTVERFQPRSDNAWLESENRLYIGGPETLRGWDYFDNDLPESWRVGLHHRILYGAEFRIPIQPQLVWFAFFFDAGSLWTDNFWEKDFSDYTMEIINEDKNNKLLYDLSDISRADLMYYFKYSWGFGIKMQIPMLPLRFWFGRKMRWVGRGKGYFKEISDFNFQFGIGDMRF
jgi:outer membrane protein insertion porin family